MPMSVVRQRAAFIERTNMQNTLNICKTRKRMSRVDKALALSSIEKHLVKELDPPSKTKHKKHQSPR